MTLPQNVAVALNFFYRDEAPSDEESWLKVIRAELHRLTAIAEGVDDMVVRLGEVTEELERLRAWNERVSVCRDHAENAVDGECLICRLEAANALLRECVVNSLGMASCGKPLCSENDHHPLCTAAKEADR